GCVGGVEGGEPGRDARQWPRVGQRSHVDGAQAHALAELARDLLGLGVSATKEEVALDGVLGGRKLVGGDVVEGGDHSRLRSQQILDFLGRRALGRRSEETPAAEAERYHRTDDDLAAAGLLEWHEGSG